MEVEKKYLVQSAKDLGDFVQVKIKDNDQILIPLEDYFMMAIKLNSYISQEKYEKYIVFQEAYKAYIKVKYRISLKDLTMQEIKNYCRHNLKLDDVLTETVMSMVSKSNLIDDHSYALNKSLYFHDCGFSKKEIKNKLVKVGINENWIEEAMDSLSDEQEYQNALDYAKKIVSSVKGKSLTQTKMSLIQKMTTKGYQIDLSRSVVDSLNLVEDDNALLLTYNKAKRLYSKEKNKQKEKIRAYCLRKGFSLSQVIEIMEGEEE